ncbi:MAG: hypothetical protein LBQ12_09275 [Deltaproteobacteria bacterium]|jgi:tetratricopeptide (TPR) repeat protein|nr:hypothetical protein [Deltaproteobacteria bacterium]
MSSKVRLKDLLREKDAFQSTTDRIYNFYLSHTNAVLLGGLAVILVALGVAAAVAITNSRSQKASEAYFLAYDPASPEKTLAAMAEVRGKQGNSKAGRLAGYAMVDAYIGLDRYQEARELADSLAAALPEPERSLAPIVYNLQGALAEQTGDLAAALGHYERAWQAVEAPVKGPDGRPVVDPLFYQASSPFRMEILNARARVTLALGRADEARLAYQEMENRFPGTPRAYAAAYKIYQIDASAAAASAGASEAAGTAPDPGDARPSPDGSEPPAILETDLMAPAAGDSDAPAGGEAAPAPSGEAAAPAPSGEEAAPAPSGEAAAPAPSGEAAAPPSSGDEPTTAAGASGDGAPASGDSSVSPGQPAASPSGDASVAPGGGDKPAASGRTRRSGRSRRSSN